jgi:glycerol-3-phosphate O-acyltransferase
MPIDPLSAMTSRFNPLFRWFARRFFRHFDLDDATVARLRELEREGSLVFVMRYASRLDYFLFNTLFLREGIALSRFANGILFHYYQPVWKWIRSALTRPRGVSQEDEHERERRMTRDVVLAGGSSFLFLRTARPLSWLRGKRGAVLDAKAELDLLGEVVRTVWSTGKPVHLVPLALFWRRGPRARRRFLNLSYGGPTRPSDLAKVTGFLSTYQNLFVKVGEPIDLAAFVEAHRDEGEARVTRKVRRSILMFLFREEKVVEGPTVQPRWKIQESVVADPGVEREVQKLAAQPGNSLESARAEARKMFGEIAANMNSTFLAVLNALVTAVERRLFVSIETIGIEKVAEYAKRNPLVLVPSHRSYFDFLIVSTLFYGNHLVPPYIAARENMAFGPFGFLWRRAGAFFLRKSFDDPVYKEVFRSYVGYLIREGFTQEFFIEGGRSRTGKTQSPRMGMLSWNVQAFLDTSRRDLFFVPIAITYERLVEEGAMLGELEGEQKADESMLGLLKARKFLRRRFGSVFVNFGEPISLAESLGRRREDLIGDDEETARERRIFVEGLGHRIAERINWAVVATATAVASCALLGERRRGVLREDLVGRMQEIVDLLRLQDVKLTPALSRDEGEFGESISSLVRSDLVKSVEDPRGEILYFEESKRRALDLYRNAIVHFLAAPSFLARSLLEGPSGTSLRQELAAWIDLFYHEFFIPRGELMAAHFDALLDHFERLGFTERIDGNPRPTEKGDGYLRFLAEQTSGLVEAYYATFTAVLAAEEGFSAKALAKTAQAHFERAALLGEVRRREAANPVTFGNAVELLVRRGILARTHGEEGRDVTYQRGPAFDDLTALRERLATALSAG